MSSTSLTKEKAPAILTRCWHTPTITIARLVLRSHFRSGWIIGDLVFIWLLYATFFLEFGGDVSYFFGTAGQGLSVLAILSTIVILSRSFNARMYLPMARITSRGAYIRGVILATGSLRIPSLLLMLLLGGSIHIHEPSFGISGATFLTLLPGAIGLLLNTIILSTLVVVLWVPIATRLIQIIFLAWLAITLYSKGSLAIFANYLSYSRIPLIPLAACYNLGKLQSFDSYSLLMIVVAVAYIVGLTWLASYWLSKRDLLLQ